MRFIVMFALLALSHAALAREAPTLSADEGFQPATSTAAQRSFVVAGLFGGTNPEISRRLASGSVGCPANEVGISNEEAHRGIHTFTAHCRGREYFCTYKYPDPISCSQTAGITDAEVDERREETAKEMEVWKEQVMGQLQQAWVKPPEYSDGQRTVMKVKLDERGRLLNLQWISRSGDGRVDKSILKAFKQIEPYPIAPDTGAAFSGVEFSFP